MLSAAARCSRRAGRSASGTRSPSPTRRSWCRTRSISDCASDMYRRFTVDQLENVVPDSSVPGGRTRAGTRRSRPEARVALLHRGERRERLEGRPRQVDLLERAVEQRRHGVGLGALLVQTQVTDLVGLQSAHEPSGVVVGPRCHRLQPAGLDVEHDHDAGVGLEVGVTVLVEDLTGPQDALLERLLRRSLPLAVDREHQVAPGGRAGDSPRSRMRSPSAFTT